ncbi:MAG TPA: glycogen debranching protein GlgX [Bauldia sp.]|nr:glycogen debranching protein GlgX [Bauldia sp.]
MPEPRLGARPVAGGVAVAVFSTSAEKIEFCLFDEAGRRELARTPLARSGDVWQATIPGIAAGARYGLRADGPYAPERGLWFDPAKLLVDPYARALDRPYAWDPRLAAPRADAIDTAALVPKAIVSADLPALPPAPRRPLGVIYELGVRSFTRLNPQVPAKLQGTVAALAHPAAVAHLAELCVDTVELMPITAWIDERHLPPLGLANAWGYNPVTFLAPDPRLAPGGMAEIRSAVAALHAAGIGVILDVVFNHTGESDTLGGTLSLRGLDNRVYYRHDPDGVLVNDTGCGNTVAAERPAVLRYILDAMRHWATGAGIDGFRLDLASILGRTPSGFSPAAPFFEAVAADPLLSGLSFIAEPWDVGPGGYQLGRFPAGWREWNDRFRDDVRMFWRGDGRLGDLATRLAGSSDFFREAGRLPSASVNFVAAHDGFTLADLVAYREKHNQANGEGNRDGTDANFSWNHGLEGPSRSPEIEAARRRDIRALLTTLFFARGTPMLTAGDEWGRTQGGNNNAYAQDNATTWLDWTKADAALAAFTARLIALRGSHPALHADAFLTGAALDAAGIPDAVWLHPSGHAMTAADWDAGGRILGLALYAGEGPGDRVVIWINGDMAAAPAWLPPARRGFRWQRQVDSADPDARPSPAADVPSLAGRSVVLFAEIRG